MEKLKVMQNRVFTSLRGTLYRTVQGTEAISWPIIFIGIASSLSSFVPRKDGIKVHFAEIE